jgi:deazaflavin-dependent oxidoreductase (nitroreductase family)
VPDEGGQVVPIEKIPSGTRGARNPPKLVGKLVMPLMMRFHRRSGDKFNGMDLVYLTTVGAKSGQQRSVSVARFDDGQGGWFVVASAAGATNHPAWYHNIVAHPDQVWAEVSGTKRRVDVEQLEGDARAVAWKQITDRAPGFNGYLAKTDRQLPVLRLTPVS